MTDTFHGTIFSTIAHTPFATFVRSSGYGNSQKLNDLLDRLGLLDHVASLEQLPQKLSARVDWSSVDDRIEQERKKTYTYLCEQIVTAVEGR